LQIDCVESGVGHKNRIAKEKGKHGKEADINTQKDPLGR